MTQMDDYISRQEAIKSLLELTTFKTKRELVERIESSIADENGWLGGVAECMDEIEDLPSAYVQPVRHGHWIEPSRHGVWIYDERAYRECDQCHTPVYLAKSMKFCPECGARMDGDTDEKNT